MTAYTLPAPDAAAKEWGRLAISIPGCRWMPGMRDGDDGSRCVRIERRAVTGLYDAIFWDGVDEGVVESDQPSNAWPDPDDPATEGCLLRLLGPCEVAYDDADPECGPWSVAVPHHFRMSATIGRACIAVAAALGEWPGGAE